MIENWEYISLYGCDLLFILSFAHFIRCVYKNWPCPMSHSLNEFCANIPFYLCVCELESYNNNKPFALILLYFLFICTICSLPTLNEHVFDANHQIILLTQYCRSSFIERSIPIACTINFISDCYFLCGVWHHYCWRKCYVFLYGQSSSASLKWTWK